MISQLEGIRSFFKASKIPSAILCYDRGKETLVYNNEAFQDFFQTGKDDSHRLSLGNQYLIMGLPKSFVEGKLEEVLRKINEENGSEEITIDYIKNGEEVGEVLQLSFTFLLEQKGKKYISHTCLPKSSDIKRRDITDKIEEEKRLQESSVNLQTLVNSIDGIIWEADPETYSFTYLSPQCYKILGYTPEEWLSTPMFWENHIHPEDKEMAISLCQIETAACRDHAFEYRMLSKWGNYIWLHDRVTVVSENGKPQKIKGVMFDVTVENQLSEDLKLLINNTDEAFILVNIDFTVRIFNDRFRQLYSRFFNENIKYGVSILTYVPEKEKEETRKLYQKVFDGKTKKTEYFFEDENENPLVFSVEFRPARNEQNEIIGAFVTSKDISAEKKMLDSIKNRERSLKNIFDRSLDIICTVDENGVFTQVSAAAENIWGYSLRELVGKRYIDLVAPEDTDRTLEAADRIFEGEEFTNFQNHYIHKNGNLVTMSWSVKWDVRERLMYCVAKDVSHEDFYHQLELMEREVMAFGMQVNVALKDVINLQLEKLEGIFPGMKTSVMKVKENKIMMIASPSMPEGFLDAIDGLPIGEKAGSCGTAAFLGKKIVVSDILKDPLWEDYRDLGIKYGFRACWSQPVFNSEGKVVATFTNYYETVKSPDDMEVQAMGRAQRLLSLILEKFEFIEQIKSSNERFENVTEATNDAIWDFDAVKNELYWSKGFETLFDFDLSTFTPTFEFLISRIHEEDRIKVIEKIQAFMSDPQSLSWFEEYRFKRGDDRFAYVIDRAKFMRSDEGKVIRVIGAMTDITHLKEYESSLENLNKTLNERAKELAISNAELEQFAYVASHDLQEPLRMVTSFLHQLERKYADIIDEKGKKYIHFAVDGAVRMRQIILDLLEYSRVGKNAEDKTEFSLNEIVKEILLLQRKNIEEKKAIINIGQLPAIRYYKSPIYQVFKNLIENALKYSEPHKIPEINISCEEREEEWILSVADNGIGIEKEYYDKIFIIFKRLHSKENYAGTGMGLAIVKKIIEGFEGNIWVDSEIDKGSVFSFTIPKKYKTILQVPKVMIEK